MSRPGSVLRPALPALLAALLAVGPLGSDQTTTSPPAAAGPTTASHLLPVTTGGGCGVTILPIDEDTSFAIANGARPVVGPDDTFLVAEYDGYVLQLRDGRLAPDFAGDGRADVPVDPDTLTATDDGGLVLAYAAYDGPRVVDLVKLAADGSPDAKFGDEGRVRIPLGGTSDGPAYGIALQPVDDGLLVASGTDDTGTVAWLDADGGGRDGFGDDGVTTIDAPWAPEHVLLDPDGRVLLVDVDGFDTEVRRLAADGTPDDSLGDGGLLVVPVSVGPGAAVGVVDTTTIAYVHPDGRQGTIDLTTGSVDESAYDLPLDSELRAVGDEVVAVGHDASGPFGLTYGRTVLRGGLDGRPLELLRTVDLVSQLRLDMTLGAGIGPDGRVVLVGTGTDWGSRDVLVSVEVGPDGDVRDTHGWCPDDDDADAPRVARLAGDDRFATAVAISREAFADGADHVMVATGTSFPDALAGGPAAAAAGAPVLLVARDALPPVVADELRRLRPSRVTVLGGATAVGDGVVDAIADVAGVTPDRLAGVDRVATAVAISRATFGDDAPIAFVTTSENFPDALAAGAVAGTLGGPVLLAGAGGVPPATMAELERLRPARIAVVGGRTALGPTYDQLVDAFGDVVVEIDGDDRFDTARGVATYFRDEIDGDSGRPVTTALVATGRNFPDALAGAAMAGIAGGVIVLAEPTTFDERVRDYLGRVDPSTIYVLGGEAAVGRVWTDELAAPEATSFTYIREPFAADDPVRWNPCAPIEWEFNPEGAPAGGLEFLRTGMARMSERTGWEFVYVGETDRSPLGDEPGVFEGIEPVVVGWVELGFGSEGVAGPSAVGSVAVGGSLALRKDSDRSLDWSDEGVGEIFDHELGHVLGLGHPGDHDQNMFWVGFEGDGLTEITAGDLAGIANLRKGGCHEVPPPQQIPFPFRRSPVETTLLP